MILGKTYLNGIENKLYLGNVLIYDPAITTLKPIMTNFRTDDTNKNRIYFDAPLGSVTGISYTDFIITGKTITAVNTTDNYFTLSTTLNYYDNILIRKEGENNTVVYDFTLQYIDNLINEPVATTNRYVEVGASGSGLSGDPMSLSDAFSQASANTTYWVKAGNYGAGPFSIGNSGQFSAPVKFVGYKTTPGDAISLDRQRLFDGLDTFDSAEMPLITGGSGDGSIDSGNNDYIILRNIQVADFASGAGIGRGININSARFFIVDNCYTTETESYGVSAASANSGYNRVINSYISDSNKGGIKLENEFNLIKNTWAVSTYDVGMDYYFTIYGGNSGISNGVKDCYVNRFTGDSHLGHGISFKADQHGDGYHIENSLVEDCEIVNSILELRHRPVKNNVFRNIDIHGHRGITLMDGPSYNIFENIYINDAQYFVRFTESVEDIQGEVPEEPHENAHNNKFINCIGDNLDLFIQTSEYPENFGMLTPIIDNTFDNCTFKDIDNCMGHLYSTTNVEFRSSNIFTNCIFDRLGYNGIGSNNFTPTFSYSDLWDSYISASGTNFAVDPLLDANYQPQATFTDIDVPRIDGVFYDKNGSERANPTTVGGVLSADEAPIDTPFAITSYEISDITSTTARVITYINEQCSINFYVDGIKNAASSDEFNASSGWPAPGTFRHGRTLTDLTPGTTSNLIIEVTAQDDGEVVQSENIPLTTLP